MDALAWDLPSHNGFNQSPLSSRWNLRVTEDIHHTTRWGWIPSKPRSGHYWQGGIIDQDKSSNVITSRPLSWWRTPAGNLGAEGAKPTRSAGQEREVNGNNPAWLVLRAQFPSERHVDHVGARHDLPVPDKDSQSSNLAVPR